MAVPLQFRKNGFSYTKEAEEVLYAIAKDQNSILQFENGEQEIFGYRLKKFHQLVYFGNQFRKVHRSYLVKLCKVVNCKWLKAILSNGEIIPLSRKGYKRVKKYLNQKKNKHFPQGSLLLLTAAHEKTPLFTRTHRCSREQVKHLATSLRYIYRITKQNENASNI